MIKMRKQKEVKCAVFKSKNETIEIIIRAINETEDIKRKTRFAERIIQEMGVLLLCEYFDERRADCKICHYVANLRKKTANLILKASLPHQTRTGRLRRQN